MRFFPWLRRASRALPFQPTPEREVNDELSFHLEQRVREYIARGMSPEAARQAALERFGNLSDVQQECTDLLTTDRRTAARRDWLGDLRQDIRFALRSFARTPLFTLLAVLTLALGIGANAAVFSVVKSVLLDGLPYANADRLVRIYSRFAQVNIDRGPLSAGTIDDLRQRQRSFTHIAAFAGVPVDAVFSNSAGPRAIKVAYVEPALFATLGVPLALGRPLRDDDAPDNDRAHAVMLSHAAWQRLFGGDASVVGKSMIINDAARTIAGILPRDFIGPVGDVDVYFPLNLAPVLRDPVQARHRQWLGAIGRLRPGVSAEVAQRELVALDADIEREHPSDTHGASVRTVPIRQALVGDTRGRLVVLMASAGLVLLIMCANLAGALLSRTLSRRKELAVRVALGAGQGRIVRQLLTESTMLAVTGGIAGIILALMAINLLRSLAATALPDYVHPALDVGALIFAFGLALVAGLAFGAAPALSARRWNTQVMLREETRGTSESRRSRTLRGLLVAGQIALSVSLLAGAGLLARSLWAMITAPLGFRPTNVLVVPVQLPFSRYGSAEARVAFDEQFAERLRGLPGVTAVGSTSSVPTRTLDRNGFTIQGTPWPNEGKEFVLYASVSDGYFRALGIPLREGRTFDATDRVVGNNAEPPVVISESMARRWWPKGDALGARIRIGPQPDAPWHVVVGIVGDVRNDPAATQPEPAMYESIRQNPWDDQTFVLRTSVDPNSLTRAVGRELAALDPGLPLSGVTALDDVLAASLAGRRLPVVLMAGFGILALVLVSVGVYAMFATMAAAREREFGVRVALGSSRGAIAALVLRQGAAWMLLGLVLGGFGIVLVGRAIRTQLFGVQAFDPLALGAAVLVLLLCAAVALFIPVRRATRADPILVLR
jgi:predicted permease